MNAEFSWFPQLKHNEYLVVFVDSEMGCLLDLNGNMVAEEKMRKGLFYRTFSSRDVALKWADDNKPHCIDVLALLYDHNNNEEYVPL